MVFTTHFFIFYFLPVALLVYYALPMKGRNLFLTFLSYIFYGWFRPWYISLMVISTIVDYTCVRFMTSKGASEKRRLSMLVISIVTELSLLCIFKYYMFAADNLNWILQLMGQQGFSVMHIALPIGISFYTFQTLSYTIDVYRKKAEPVKSFFDFSCFVSLFPHLIAGPIIRFNTIDKQLAHREPTIKQFTRGILLFMIGFAKKIILANPCGIIADSVFNAQAPAPLDAWFGVIAYAFQIYFDFCGYSDMAVGVGRMFGFELLKNFDAPYISKSITEIWQRWHISLSTWLRDYLYIPLGGNRKGEKRTYFNLLIVMLLGGLWHGAHWQFILWGCYHGSLLIVERFNNKKTFYSRLPGSIQILITFVLMLFSWVLFRAENLTLAMQYFGAMFGLAAPSPAAPLLGLKIYSPFLLIIFGLSAYFAFNKIQAMDLVEIIDIKKSIAVVIIFIVAIAAMFTQSYNPFLYFQF
jgi:alginate O-acetyltransferase complex protein AlgI